jgi:hypothetical protein
MKIADNAAALVFARYSRDTMTKYLTHRRRQSGLNDIRRDVQAGTVFAHPGAMLGSRAADKLEGLLKT